jgi:hypothetical protein
MAYAFTILGITGIGIIWILGLLKQECDGRRREQGLVKFLAEEIGKLRKDVDSLKK